MNLEDRLADAASTFDAAIEAQLAGHNPPRSRPHWHRGFAAAAAVLVTAGAVPLMAKLADGDDGGRGTSGSTATTAATTALEHDDRADHDAGRRRADDGSGQRRRDSASRWRTGRRGRRCRTCRSA